MKYTKKGFAKLKKKKMPAKTILIIAAVAVIGFLISMGNYLVALCATVIIAAGAAFWYWPELQCALGQSEYAKGNNTKALALLKKAHESSRSKPSVSAAYAYILLRVGQAEEASKVLNYVLLNSKLKEQDRAQLRQILSLVRYRQGDFEEATRLMELVFEVYKNTGVYGALGYYKILSNSPDMEKFNEEAYDYNSGDKVIIDNMVILALKKGDLQKAKELSDKSIGAGNRGVEIFYHAGQTYEALGENDKAADFFRKAKSCQRSFMTTVTEAEVENAIERLGGNGEDN